MYSLILPGKSFVWLFGQTLRSFAHHNVLPDSTSCCESDELAIAPEIQEIEFDEMWHFIQSKKEKSGLLKPWIVAQGELLPGYSVVVMLQRSNGATISQTFNGVCILYGRLGCVCPGVASRASYHWQSTHPYD